MNPYLQLAGFTLIVLCLPGIATYRILFGAACFNVTWYIVTPSLPPWMVWGYSVIDTATLLIILHKGDKHKIYQCLLLLGSLLSHYLAEMDTIVGSSTVLGDYLKINAAITILQMLGVFIDGFSNLIRKLRANRSHSVKRNNCDH